MSSQLPMRMLHELINSHGRMLSAHPGRCRDLLLEMCPLHRREVDLIVTVAELGMVDELLQAGPDYNWHELTDPMVRRMCAGGSIGEVEARSAIEAWAQAMGVDICDAPFVPLASIEEVEAERLRDERRRSFDAGRAGWWGGGGTGLAISFLYATVWLFARWGPKDRPADLPWLAMVVEWVVMVLAGMVLGAVFGGLAGLRLGQAMPHCARMIAGGVVGVCYGAAYHGIYSPLVARQVADDWAFPVELALGILVGLIGGTLLGLLADRLPLQPKPDEDRQEVPDFKDPAVARLFWPFR